eukprot:13330761-Ditylum_brightwellii.AAC.2
MRACYDLGDRNWIISVHDQGVGGNGTVLKEIVEPAGAVYAIHKNTKKTMPSSPIPQMKHFPKKMLIMKTAPSVSWVKLVLGKMPQKTFVDNYLDNTLLKPFKLPAGQTMTDVVNYVLHLLAVGSKCFLVHK